ncbi:MAG: PVC-type heme-binding CxxCH protein, partial [Opitutaceae bacterium]
MREATRSLFRNARLAAALVASSPFATLPAAPAPEGAYRAGAAKVDITPVDSPVRVNGGFLEKTATQAHDRLHARALVIANGHERVAICVVDTCMLPRELIDRAKAAAAKITGIGTDRMLVSATHTHSAPAAMGCLGARIDPAYAAFLPPKIAEAIAAAASREQPARIGRGAVDAWELTNCRRWIRRPDRLLPDPFGEMSVRANMHPGYESPDVTGPAGPIDPQLTLLSVQTVDGTPLAILGNFSMHYFGAPPLSADFCGRFAEGIGRLVGAKEGDDFVGILSQGTSGDSHWMDYSRPQAKVTLDDYSERLLTRAAEVHRTIEHRGSGQLVMAEATLRLQRRLASAARMEWARNLAEPLGDRPAANQREVYAREQLFLAAEPERELKLQALRIGETGVTAIPNEVYALTGLKLKARSPLPATFNIELANGAEGYIPPPEQHFLGGYTTWAARTAGLEEQAEPKIVEALLGLLERVAGATRRDHKSSNGDYARAVLADRPHAYWRLDESEFPAAADATGAGRNARFEPGVALHLPGAQSAADAISAVPENPSAFSGPRINRAPHFAGGRLRAELPALGRDHTVEFWVWNALPVDARPVTGVLWSRGPEGEAAAGEHLSIGGTTADGASGRLRFESGDGRSAASQGRNALGFRTWHHVALVRSGDRVRVHLDGRTEPEIDAAITAGPAKPTAEIFFAGRCDGFAPFEGKIDEVAVYDRALTAAEIAAHFAASGRAVPASAVTRTPVPDVAPLSPEESLRKFHVAPGFRVELAAAEPLVADPVAFDWDSRGRLWVVEMADYPLGLDGKGAPGGRVRVLEDTDGDGRYDRSTLFADGLNFPNGILTWRDGVIVTAAPHILFLRDTDGDGKADSREVLVSGLFEGNQQLRANGLRWGLDNWVHVASGGHHRGHGAATKLKSHRNGAEVATGSRDFRFRPDTGELEPQSG